MLKRWQREAQHLRPSSTEMCNAVTATTRVTRVFHLPASLSQGSCNRLDGSTARVQRHTENFCAKIF